MGPVVLQAVGPSPCISQCRPEAMRRRVGLECMVFSHIGSSPREPDHCVFRDSPSPPLQHVVRLSRRRRCRVVAALSAESANTDRSASDSSFGRVVVPTALALMLCNMDRICMSVAILPMSREFGWSPSLQGIIQSAFLWGYMATPILGGTLADQYGGKLVMAAGVVWFSLASLLMPLLLTPKVAETGMSLALVLACRAAVGLGEGVALPSMVNLVSRRVPPALRTTALGSAFTGFHAGNLLGLVASPLLLASYGWRALFLWFGFLGAPLLSIWLSVVPGQATPSPPSQAAGGERRRRPGMLDLLGSSATWAIIVVNIVNHWGYFIYLNWMPSYFYRSLGLDLKASSMFAFLPWTVMAVGSSLAGGGVDWLLARGVDRTRLRKAVQTVAFLLPAGALLVLSSRSLTPALALSCMTAALGITSLGQAGFVANMSDIAPTRSGQLFGLCNTFGTFAGIVGSSAVGFVVEKTGSFDPIFKATAVLYLIGILVWNLFCTAEKVFD